MFKEINILRLFLEKPNTEFNVREVARLVKIAPATASKELKKFVKERILVLRKERNLDLYKSDIDSEKYRDLKVYYTLRKIKESGIIEELNKYYLKPTIVLFGSASNGRDIENSDYDLLIITERKVELMNVEEFEKKLNKKIQLFANKNIKDLKNPNLINNVLNGIIIQGELSWE